MTKEGRRKHRKGEKEGGRQEGRKFNICPFASDKPKTVNYISHIKKENMNKNIKHEQEYASECPPDKTHQFLRRVQLFLIQNTKVFFSWI